MAKYVLELPTQLVDMYENIWKNADEMLAEMTQEGAKVVYNNIKANVPNAFLGSDIMHNLYITGSYKTPSDGGINTKVGFYGYFTDEDGRQKPAPLVANVFEYGRSDSPFPKQPFLRKSFSKRQIEEAMKRAQKKWGVTD